MVNAQAQQRTRALLTLEVDGCDEELRIVRFSGRESIATLFEFRLEVAAGDLALDALVGHTAVLTIEGIDCARHVHGLVCQAAHAGESRRYMLYELTLVPSLWRLQQRSGSRIFQQLTTPQILVKVLEGAGLPRASFRLECLAPYVPRDYCVQYRESDFDFISRLMEADGIFYYFEHSVTNHVLVLTDRAEGAPTIAGDSALSAGPERGLVRDRERVSNFRLSEQLRPERVTLRDMNLHHPDESMEASEGSGNEREVYDYPGSYQESGRNAPHKGGQQAKLRLQALQAPRRRGLGTSDSARLVPGFIVELTGNTRHDLDGSYRLVSVLHRGEQPQVLDEDAAGEFRYGNDFECVESKVPFRAPRTTPRPNVRGVQTATVVGPAGEEIHVDEHGRVKVQFHWDRRDAHDESSSCWVRVSQLWAGNGFGGMFLPRVGHEVIIDFIEGDPDRPLVTGHLYTGLNTPPYPLPDEKTKSTIRTESSPGGGGSNELRFEDARGREEIYIHGQRDWTIAIEHDKEQTIGNDASLQVGHDRRDSVGHDESAAIGNDRMISVGHQHTEVIGADMTIAVGANLSEAVTQNASYAVGVDRSEAVGMANSLVIGSSHTVIVGGSMTETVGQTKAVSVAEDSSETVGGGKNVHVAENLTTNAGKNIVLSASKHLNISTGESLNASVGKQASVIVADKMTLKCGDATVTITKNGDVTIKAKKLSVKASGDVVVKGANVKLN